MYAVSPFRSGFPWLKRGQHHLLLSKITFSDQSGSEILAEFDGKIKLSYELSEFIRQHEAQDYDSCYKMLDHSVTVAEVVDELLK